MGRRKSNRPSKREGDRGGAGSQPPAGRSGGFLAGKGPILRFIAIFAVSMGIFYAFTALPFFREGIFPRYLRLNASVSALLLRGLGEDAQAQGLSVISPRYAVTIQRGCDAIEPSALFASAVIGFPAAWRRRLGGAVVGVALLLVLNLARILSLYYTGVFKPSAFETMHLDVWQPAFIFLALLLWILWAVWATRRTAPPAQRHVPA